MTLSNAVPKPARREKKARKPIQRSRLKRRGPSKAETERVYGPAAFRAWLRLTPCLWCGITRPIEQAHLGKHGVGKRNDWRSTAPLCGAFTVGAVTYPGCHNRLDRRSSESSWFTAEERHTLALRQQAFIAAWDARTGSVVEQRVPPDQTERA